jgi:hypothetical protein
MTIGTIFIGQIKTQEGQYVETKMFCFIFPLYVVTTLLVTGITGDGRVGVEIKTQKISVIAAYLRLFITIAFIFSIGATIGNYDTMSWLFIPLIFTAGLTVYLWFYFGKSTKYENFIREQFAKQLDLYILPKWMKPHQVKNHFETFKKAYLAKNNASDWKVNTGKLNHYDEAFSLAFCLTALENEMKHDDSANNVLKNAFQKYSD